MISGVDDAAVERIVQSVLDAIGRGEGESPAELLLLLRRYVSTGRPELSEALGTALARALDRCTSPDRREDLSSEWLGVFVEAAAISQDERLPAAAESMVTSMRRSWPARGELRASFRAVESCLAAAHLGNEDDVATSAIDELERIVGRSYEPGDGLAGQGLLEHSAAASALLTAFAVAGRLPYAMLADELIQFARRSWWNERLGGFDGNAEPSAAQNAEPSTAQNAEPSTAQNAEPSTAQNAERFVANCEMARVLCRMALLHADSSYRDIAVLAPRANYAEDARRTLARLAPPVDPTGDSALYALALDEYLKIESFPHAS
jgi:hypothetical protein